MVRNPAEAEDVTQTTFLNAYRAMQAGAKPRRPHNWLIAIAHNTCRSSVRRAMRRPQEVPLGDDMLAVSDPEAPNLGELLRRSEGSRSISAPLSRCASRGQDVPRDRRDARRHHSRG